MIPAPARYLLRIDDLCPTVSRSGWEQCARLIEQFSLRALLAVVPDNRDPGLVCSPANQDFWSEMRSREQAGCSIGLHGYQHLCVSAGRSLLPFHRTSEFAGVPRETQRRWIRAGLHLLREQGLSPRLWVAPRHGFDGDTLRVLREEGIRALSDGLGRIPVVRRGITWIPQQLWGPAEREAGIWTICLHPNTARPADFERLRVFLRSHAGQFADFEQVIAMESRARWDVQERAYARLALWKLRLRILRSAYRQR